MAASVILVEATPRSAIDGAPVIERLAGGGAELPYRYGGNGWRAGITELPSMTASLDFDGEQLGGGGVAQAIELRWAPADSASLDDLASLFWADAPIVVRIGPEDASFALPPVKIDGLALEAASENGVLAIALADQAADLKRPLLVDRFAGTGGVEGSVEFEGLIKSRCWGICFNVPGRLLDKANQVWCFGDPMRPWLAIDQVRDKGVAAKAETLTVLGWQGSVAATFAALQAAKATEGGGVLCPSIACVKWWTEPAGDLHADIRGETAGGYVDTAPAIAARIVAARSTLAFADGTVEAAIAARPGKCGWRVDNDTATAAETISTILGGVSLSWRLTGTRIVLCPWDWSAPVREGRSHRVARRQTYKPIVGRKLGYRRNWSPMARGDLGAFVLVNDVVYDDGRTVGEAIADAATTAIWDKVADPTGTKPADNATNSADPDSPFGTGTVGEAIATLDEIVPIKARQDAITSDVSALKDARVQSDKALALLGTVQTGHEIDLRQIGRDAGRASDAILTMLSQIDRHQVALSDAGVIFDPTTGKWRIYAVAEQAERISQAEIAIEGQAALISLKASTIEVSREIDEKLALAVLDPSQVAQLEPLFARLRDVEVLADGLNAAIQLTASAIDVDQLGARVLTAEQQIDAIEGQIVTKVERTAFEGLLAEVGSVRQTLESMGDVSRYSLEVRQARSIADSTKDATLATLFALDDVNKRQIAASAFARQELTATMDGDRAASAKARQELGVAIDDTRALTVAETKARIDQGAAFASDIRALGAVTEDQAAAIGRLDEATIVNGQGLARAVVTIRQQAQDIGAGTDATLAALFAGDDTTRRVVGLLAQVQQEFTTSLVAGQAASAEARQALIARLGLAEAATETVSKALADTEKSLVTRLAASEAVINDATTGLAATRARLIAEEQARATQFAALAESQRVLDAQVNDPNTGLEAAYTLIGEKEAAQALVNEANATKVEQVTAQVNHPATGLPATRTSLADEVSLRAQQTNANAIAVQELAVELHDPNTGLPAAFGAIANERQLSIDRDNLNASRTEQVRLRLGDDDGTGVTIEDKINAVVERTGKIEGTRTIAIDINGNMVGTQLVGSEEGPGSFNLINVDLRIGTGRIIFNNGIAMLVQGIAFGAQGDLIEWFGPTMAIADCSRANAVAYKTTTAEAYFGGGLNAATLVNQAGSSSLGSAVTADVGPFGSNGKPVKVIASWSYTTSLYKTYDKTTEGANAFDADAAYYSANEKADGFFFGQKIQSYDASTITLKRSFNGTDYADLQSANFTDETQTFRGIRPTVGDAPGNARFMTAIGGGFTVNDPVQSVTPRWLRLVLARGLDHGTSGAVQRLSIVATEE